MSQLFPRCGQCGSEIEEGCVFCPNCGATAPPSAQQSQGYQAARPHPWMEGSQSQPLPPHAEQQRPPQYQQPQQQQYQPQYATPAPAYQVVYQQFVPQTENTGLASAGRALGIVALSMMLVGLVPCLGWVNWFMFPLSVIAFIVSVISAITAKNERARGMALMGLIFAVIAGLVGFVRLALGGGCL